MEKVITHHDWAPTKSACASSSHPSSSGPRPSTCPLVIALRHAHDGDAARSAAPTRRWQAKLEHHGYRLLAAHIVSFASSKKVLKCAK